MKYSFPFLLSAGLAAAAPRTIYPTNSAGKILVTSGSGRINSLDFDGSKFTFTNELNLPAGVNPSWAAFKSPNLLYAVNENANTLHTITYDPTTNDFTQVSVNNGSTGVVHLQFSPDGKTLAGASFTNGSLDIWDSSATDGSLKLLSTIKLNDSLGPLTGQTAVQAHQSIRDPSGRFVVVPERGADTLSILDSNDGFAAPASKVRVQPAGCGPRHGAFIKGPNGKKASHFVLVCEMANLIQLFKVDYKGKALDFTFVQSLSTFGADMPSKNPTTTVVDASGTKVFAAAGEVVVAENGRDIYVSNRLTGNEADSIARFELGCRKNGTLKYGESVSSFGISPRMFSLSLGDESVLFATNMANGTGLLAYKRDANGKLAVIEESKVDIEEFRDEVVQFGPEFVQQIYGGPASYRL